MNDKELLEFSAKAAGYYLRVEDGVLIAWEDHGSDMVGWNPLHDSGYCFSLAAILHMSVSFGPMESHACTISGALRGNQFTEKHIDHNMDIGAATRLAITRAAAEEGQHL